MRSLQPAVPVQAGQTADCSWFCHRWKVCKNVADFIVTLDLKYVSDVNGIYTLNS